MSANSKQIYPDPFANDDLLGGYKSVSIFFAI